MTAERNKSDPTRAEQETKVAFVDEVMSRSLMDLVSSATEADLLGPDQAAEKARGNTGAATCWLHAPAVLWFSALSCKRLLKVAELDGMRNMEVPKIVVKLIGKSKVLLIKPASETDRTAFEVRRYARTTGARANLFDLLGSYGLTEPTGYRERFDVLYVPKGSPLWPGLLVDLGAPRERRTEPHLKKKKDHPTSM